MKKLIVCFLLALIPLASQAQEKVVKSVNSLNVLKYVVPDPNTLYYVEGLSSSTDGKSAFYRYEYTNAGATNYYLVAPANGIGRWKYVPMSSFSGSLTTTNGTITATNFSAATAGIGTLTVSTNLSSVSSSVGTLTVTNSITTTNLVVTVTNSVPVTPATVVRWMLITVEGVDYRVPLYQ